LREIFVAGATGFAGHHLARELAAQGADLRLLVRKSSNLANLDGISPKHRLRSHRTSRSSLHKPGLMSLLRDRRDGILVEGDECLPAHPPALVGNDSIRKILTGPEHRQTRLQLRNIRHDIRSATEQLDRSSDLGTVKPVIPPQHPNKLAQARQGHDYQFCGSQNLVGHARLMLVVADGNANENVGVHRDLQS
jgi:hypothetical protein